MWTLTFNSTHIQRNIEIATRRESAKREELWTIVVDLQSEQRIADGEHDRVTHVIADAWAGRYSGGPGNERRQRAVTWHHCAHLKHKHLRE